jgi:formiminotetrahydrofolate cyclodeaminase
MHVLELTLKQFLSKTNQERPEITGGCVLMTNASLTAAMILMGLRISLKKSGAAADRRFLRAKIKALSSIQIQLADAAEADLLAFDEYRSILKSKAKSRPQKLESALEQATDSLLSICKVLNQAIFHTDESKSYTHVSVLSDVIAGKLILEAVFNALIALAEGNMNVMPEQAKAKYDRWKDRLQAV